MCGAGNEKSGGELCRSREKSALLPEKVKCHKEYKNQGVFAALSLGQLRTDPSCNTNNSSRKRNTPYLCIRIPIAEKGWASSERASRRRPERELLLRASGSGRPKGRRRRFRLRSRPFSGILPRLAGRHRCRR